MDILVLADTHIARAGVPLPAAVLAALPCASLILHAGDVTHPAVLRALERYAPVYAVAGNNDEPALAAQLPARACLRADGLTIGLVHGHGARGTTFERAQAAFSAQPVDCVVFGHSHRPMVEWVDGRLYLNPGSPTQRRREPAYSFAWLRTGPRLTAEIVRFPTRQ